jgi:hypothetical protein
MLDQRASGLQVFGAAIPQGGNGMQHTRGNQFTVAVRLMSEPCLWRWEIREPAQGEMVANSWTSEWMAYESPDEAFRAGQARLTAISRR